MAAGDGGRWFGQGREIKLKSNRKRRRQTEMCVRACRDTCTYNYYISREREGRRRERENKARVHAKRETAGAQNACTTHEDKDG